jgi:hypothetical protein
VSVDIWHPGLEQPFTLVLADARLGRDHIPQLLVSLQGFGDGRLVLDPELTGEEDDSELTPAERPRAPETPSPERERKPDEVEVWPVPIRPRRRRWRFLLVSVSELSASPTSSTELASSPAPSKR